MTDGVHGSKIKNALYPRSERDAADEFLICLNKLAPAGATRRPGEHDS
jgi:hypothetical protein